MFDIIVANGYPYQLTQDAYQMMCACVMNYCCLYRLHYRIHSYPLHHQSYARLAL